MIRARLLAAFTVATCALVLLSACASGRTLDRVELESQVAVWIFPNHPELVEDVQCPVIDDPQPGDRFACSAAIGDQIIALTATLTAGPAQADGSPADQVRVELVSDARFVAAEEIAQLLADRFSAEIGIQTEVDCGQPVVVIEPTEPLVCVATDASGVARTFDVAVADDGTIDLTLR